MEVNGDMVTFSTGKTVSANRGIIGIDPELNVSEGYDSGFPAWPTLWEDDEVLTKEERQELADYMIALWTKFREADHPEGAE